MHELNNGFYQSFDTETIDGPRTPDHIRTPFQHDRDRVIYTSAFRRLQAKTQVFRSGEYDFYRTRLTHTIEVAQIGRGICNYLKKTGAILSDTFYVDPDLVEACCLAHDIGHPPFGHAGEKSLHRLMKAFGGFEGNAQTLRLLTETIFSDGPKRAGMNPTRAFIDGVLKYKTLFSHRQKEKHFIYDDQERFLRFVNGGSAHECVTNRAPEIIPAELQRKSVECQIMDWADDTAYSLGDLIDGIRAKFITPYTIEKWAQDDPLGKDADNARSLEGLIEAIRKRNISRFAANKIGQFIEATSLKENPGDLATATNRHRFELVKEVTSQREYTLYNRLAVDLVFVNPQVHQLEYKGDQILQRIFGSLIEAYVENQEDGRERLKLVPQDTERMILAVQAVEKAARARLVCDHLAGMSDDFAVRTFRRLFDADFGSIVDLV